jgi:hypothetical protein
MVDRSTLLEERPGLPPPPEAVIREARRRQRRRRSGVTGIVVVAVVIVVVVLPIGSRSVRRPPSPVAVSRGPSATPVEPVDGIHPSQPGPLAVGGTGTLYIADEAQNRILARLPSGRFRVIAGDGKKGFSGDGGPAVDAELDNPQGIAVAADGTVYFADFFNNRVRAVSPAGIITTVAGNGQGIVSFHLPVSGMPATAATVPEPTSVAIGPGGSLYVAAYSDVLELEPGGVLNVVEDGSALDGSDPGVMFQEGCYPASLAFDGTGNLYIGCSSPWVLLVRAADGSLRQLGMARPHDAWAAMTSTPDGGVLAIEGTDIVRYGSPGRPVPIDFLTYRLPGGRPFWPQGIAAAADGSIYLSQDGVSGIGPAAILEESPSGTLSVLWPTKPATGLAARSRP